MAQVLLTRLRIGRQRRRRQPIVRTVHAALRGGLALFCTAMIQTPATDPRNFSSWSSRRHPAVRADPRTGAPSPDRCRTAPAARAARHALPPAFRPPRRHRCRVQRHHRQSQQQLLGRQRRDTQPPFCGQIRLPLDRRGFRVGLGFNQQHRRAGLDWQPHRSHATLTDQLSCARSATCATMNPCSRPNCTCACTWPPPDISSPGSPGSSATGISKSKAARASASFLTSRSLERRPHGPRIIGSVLRQVKNTTIPSH